MLGLALAAAAAVLGEVKVTLKPMFEAHGKPGMVALGDDLYTHGGAASGCLTGVRRSSDSGASFGPLLCAVKNSPPDPDLHGCRLRDGPVVMGDEVTHELVLVFWCSSRLPPVAPRTNAQDEVWVTRSGDRGESWSKPANITASVQPPDQTGIVNSFGAIGGGIQATNGRLIGQGYGEKCFTDADGNCNRTAHRAFTPDGESPTTWAEINHVIYSDDHGCATPRPRCRCCCCCCVPWLPFWLTLPLRAAQQDLACLQHLRNL